MSENTTQCEATGTLQSLGLRVKYHTSTESLVNYLRQQGDPDNEGVSFCYRTEENS